MILLGLPCPRTSLTRLQAPQSTGIELARLLRLVPSILRELDEGVGRHECATRRTHFRAAIASDGSRPVEI
jgi:hypothetical protein